MVVTAALSAVIGTLSAGATNIVTYTLLDSVTTTADELIMTFRRICNENDRTNILFDLTSSNSPFTIYKVEWTNGGVLNEPLEPFSLIAQGDEIEGKSSRWHISLDFPFSNAFHEEDVLLLTTDRGVIYCPTSRAGQLQRTIDLLRYDYEKELDSTKRSSRNAWAILGIVVCMAVVAGVIVGIVVRRRFVRKRKEIEELSLLVVERSDRNRELQAKIDALYGSRLDTLNMLCNECFEKNESDRVKLSLYNEVEKHILALRDSKSVTQLEDIVNTYLDGIVLKVREQIPSLSAGDIKFLTYLYAGFSPRAVCIFTDIKIKNFYNRRSRLKERILDSGAPDRLLFVSKM